MLSRRMWTGVGMCLVAISGTAHGQDAPPRQDQQPPLKGPQVKQTRPPGLDEDFGEGMKPGKEGMRGPMIPMRAYADVIDKLRGDKAPEGLRLSEEQEKKIGGIEQDFRDAAREYAQKMRAERGAQGNGKPDDSPEARREVVREMVKGGVRPGDYQTQIWAALDQKQQAYVKVELDKVRDEIQKKRGEEMMQRRLEQRRGGKGADQPNVTPVAGQEAAPVRERVQRIVRRMAQLPPEDRDRILKRLEEELDKRGIPDAPPPAPPPPGQPPREDAPPPPKDH